MPGAGRGAVDGAATGLIVGLLGEVAVAVTSQLFPTDVLIFGLALIWSVPLCAVAGALGGWRGWLQYRIGRALVAAPGLLAAAFAVIAQWSAR